MIKWLPNASVIISRSKGWLPRRLHRAHCKSASNRPSRSMTVLAIGATFSFDAYAAFQRPTFRAAIFGLSSVRWSSNCWPARLTFACLSEPCAFSFLCVSVLRSRSFVRMGIDPGHSLCVPFYAAMRRLGLVLLSHTGVEHSVDFGFHDSQSKRETHRAPLPLPLPLRPDHERACAKRSAAH